MTYMPVRGFRLLQTAAMISQLCSRHTFHGLYYFNLISQVDNFLFLDDAQISKEVGIIEIASARPAKCNGSLPD